MKLRHYFKTQFGSLIYSISEIVHQPILVSKGRSRFKFKSKWVRVNILKMTAPWADTYSFQDYIPPEGLDEEPMVSGSV